MALGVEHIGKVMKVHSEYCTGRRLTPEENQQFVVSVTELVTIANKPSHQQLLAKKEELRLDSVKRRYSKVTGFDPDKLKLSIEGNHYTASFKAQELGTLRGDGRLIGIVTVGVHGVVCDTFTEKQLANRE